jgi:anti-anti-sigma factor
MCLIFANQFCEHLRIVPMDLMVSRQDGNVIATTAGPIDETAGELFRGNLYECLRDAGTILLLDLSGSAYINSFGVSHLVSLAAYANSKSSRVILCCLGSHVAGVLAVTKLDRYFEIAPTLAAAIQLARAKTSQDATRS